MAGAVTADRLPEPSPLPDRLTPKALRDADRKLRLAGYEVYRFGGHELADRLSASGLPGDFFSRLLSEPDERP
jgi:hypothetical protein